MTDPNTDPLFVSHPDPIVFHDDGTDPTVGAINPAFGRQFGVNAADLVGQSVDEALAAAGIDSDPEAIQPTADAASGLATDMELTAADGRTYGLRAVDAPGSDAANADVDATDAADAEGVYLCLTDVTAYAETRADLEAANERLDGFARTVAHDLRNPLEVAQSRLSAARETGDAVHFEKTADAHDRIARLIDDVLTLARSGRAISTTESVDLRAVVADAWATVDAEAASLAVGADLGTVTADRERLRTLFENLFRNSIEHAGPAVTIGVDTTDDGFVVVDDGPGIPPSQRESVFEAGVTTGEGTTGLGLNIVREIAVAHGWEVSLTESSKGGVLFAFDLSA